MSYVCILRADGTVSYRNVSDDNLIGCVKREIGCRYVEQFAIGSYFGFMDEEGFVSGKPQNLLATSIYRPYHLDCFPLVGDVCILTTRRKGRRAGAETVFSGWDSELLCRQAVEPLLSAQKKARA